MPSSFYGNIQVDGANVGPGTSIKALIGNLVFAEARTLIYEGSSVFTINVPGDDIDTPEVDGGREGEEIFFEIGGLVADQTGTWHSGTNVGLNLTVSSQEQVSETVILDTQPPTQTITQPVDSGSMWRTQPVQETYQFITPMESPPGSFIPITTAPSPTPHPVQIIPIPKLIDEASAEHTTVYNPEPALGDSQVDIHSATIEQESPNQYSSTFEGSSPGSQSGILSRPELFLVVGGIILIGAAAILIWIRGK